MKYFTLSLFQYRYIAKFVTYYCPYRSVVRKRYQLGKYRKPIGNKYKKYLPITTTVHVYIPQQYDVFIKTSSHAIIYTFSHCFTSSFMTLPR